MWGKLGLCLGAKVWRNGGGLSSKCLPAGGSKSISSIPETRSGVLQWRGGTRLQDCQTDALWGNSAKEVGFEMQEKVLVSRSVS